MLFGGISCHDYIGTYVVSHVYHVVHDKDREKVLIEHTE